MSPFLFPAEVREGCPVHSPRAWRSIQSYSQYPMMPSCCSVWVTGITVYRCITWERAKRSTTSYNTQVHCTFKLFTVFSSFNCSDPFIRASKVCMKDHIVLKEEEIGLIYTCINKIVRLLMTLTLERLLDIALTLSILPV